MKSIAIRRLHLLPIEKGAGFSDPNKFLLTAQLAEMGYRLTNPKLLDGAANTTLGELGVLKELNALRGGDVDYVPLFLDFPDNVPDDETYFAKRVLGYLLNFFKLARKGARLEDGTIIPSQLFQLEKFGANPITQFQSKELWERARIALANRLADTHTQWIDLELAWDGELIKPGGDWLAKNLYANSSIKEALRDDLNCLLDLLGPASIDFERVAMKENQAFLLKRFWENGRNLDTLRLQPSDLLRLFAALTDSDISLSTQMKFPKFSRPQRRVVLSILEKATNLAEDLNRYRGLWLQIDRYLRATEHKRQFPKSNLAFTALRSDSIVTFNAHMEQLIAVADVDALLKLLSKRPGILGRRLHQLLRRFPDGTFNILTAFKTASSKMTVKLNKWQSRDR